MPYLLVVVGFVWMEFFVREHVESALVAVVGCWRGVRHFPTNSKKHIAVTVAALVFP